MKKYLVLLSLAFPLAVQAEPGGHVYTNWGPHGGGGYGGGYIHPGVGGPGPGPQGTPAPNRWTHDNPAPGSKRWNEIQQEKAEKAAKEKRDADAKAAADAEVDRISAAHGAKSRAQMDYWQSSHNDQIVPLKQEIFTNMRHAEFPKHLSDDAQKHVKGVTHFAYLKGVTASEWQFEGHAAAGKLMYDFSKELLTSVKDFTRGVVDGTYDSFYETADAMRIIFNRPELLAHLSDNIMHVMTDPTPVFNDFKSAAVQFWRGDAYHKSYAASRLFGQTVQALAYPGLGTAEKSRMNVLFLRHMPMESRAVVGEAIFTGIEKNPALAPQVAAIREGVNEAKVYHRLMKPADCEVEGELWGKARRNIYAGVSPEVKAYEGPLPAGREGIEFVTDIKPDSGTAPGSISWSGSREGITSFTKDNADWVKIPVKILKKVTQ